MNEKKIFLKSDMLYREYTMYPGDSKLIPMHYDTVYMITMVPVMVIFL